MSAASDREGQIAARAASLELPEGVTTSAPIRSHSTYFGDMEVENPGTNEPVPLSAPLTITLDRPTMVAIGYWVGLDQEALDEQRADTTVQVGLELLSGQSGGEFDGLGPQERGYTSLESSILDGEWTLRLSARFQQATGSVWEIDLTTPDPAEGNWTISIEGEDDVTIPWGISPEDLTAELPEGWEATDGINSYRLAAPVDGPAITNVTDDWDGDPPMFYTEQDPLPAAPDSVTFKDVTQFWVLNDPAENS